MTYQVRLIQFQGVLRISMLNQYDYGAKFEHVLIPFVKYLQIIQ